MKFISKAMKSYSSREVVVADKNAYKSGDKLIFEGYGVCTVTKVQEDGTLVIKDDNRGTSLLVRPSMMDKVRNPISRAEANRILKDLKPKADIAHTTWNRRYRELMGKMGSSKAQDLAEVLKELAAIRKENDLSFGEKKMFDLALSNLSSEIAAALGKPASELESEISSKLYHKL